MAQKSGTALGVARSRFVEGLPRKAQELKGAIALLVATPAAARPREELRRRLHALYASAQVFRLESLATALKEAIQRLDASREAGLSQDDLDALSLLAATLPALGARGEDERGSVYPTGPRASAPGEAVAPSVAPYSPPAPRVAPPEAPLPRPPSIPGLAGPGARTAAPRPNATPARTDASPAAAPAAAPMSSSASGLGRLPARPDAPLDTVVSVLVVDRPEVQAAVREALPGERYEVFGATDAEAGLRLARTVAPDVVLFDAGALAQTSDLVVRLHADAATELVPVGALVDETTAIDEEQLRARGVDALLHKPATPVALRRLIDRLAVRERTGPTSDVLGDATVEEVADRLAREIRRGLVEAAAVGRDERIELGDGSELLAAAWATIARVRAELADRSHGKVRFRDGARRGGPAFMALAGDEETDRGDGDVSLEGRRVVIADDDPAVVWFFAGLLREAGAHAVECEDGREALDEARRKRPDVIVSDILMPRLDGLALCRELKRDPGLADVPVVLLSWKEDFLQRMRELQSGASGYLRKEAGSGQILAKIREVLRPRARLEARLRAGGEVRGRIESVGVQTLLQTTAALRRDARVTLRDAWSLFEVDVREGQLVDVTRTATDGSFSRGERALPALLGVSTGRFTVDDAEGTVRPSLEGDSEAVLRAAGERLGAHVDAVSGTNLTRVARVRFDELLLQAFLRTSLGETRMLVERIAAGESPRALLVEGRVSPVVVETALVDLARRGAVTGVRDEDGEDLVAAALEARRAHAAKPSILPRPRPEAESTSMEAEPALPLTDAAATPEVAHELEELLHAPTNPPPEPPPALRVSTPPAEVAPREVAASDDRQDSARMEASATSTSATSTSATPASANPASANPASATPSSATPAPSSASPAAVSTPEPEGMGFAGWAVLVLLFGVAGYFGWRAWREPTPSDAAPRTGQTVEGQAAPRGASEAMDDRVSGDEDEAPVEVPTAELAEGSREASERAGSELSFGRTVPGVADPEVTVADGQGLLRVEASDAAVRVALRRRGDETLRELGEAPVAVALDEGQYELVFRRDEGESVRFLFVRSGQTRIVRPER